MNDTKPPTVEKVICHCKGEVETEKITERIFNCWQCATVFTVYTWGTFIFDKSEPPNVEHTTVIRRK